MLSFTRNLFRHRLNGFVFSRPLVVLQSDDWGRVGIRDREGYECLRSRGLMLGEHAYDLYSLETTDDVTAVAGLLSRHRDSAGRPACMVMNFCMANLDFKAIQSRGFSGIELLPLARGLPGSWSRPGLLEAYRAGIRDGLFYPGIHGLTHFCPTAVEDALQKGGDRAQLLRLLWEAESPYIYWRMPWIGYEHWNPEGSRNGYLRPELQSLQVRKARECFVALFGTEPRSACAPGYYANLDTRRAWLQAGIQVAQNGAAAANGWNAPRIDEFGLLQLYRAIDFEPSQREPEIDKCLQVADSHVARGLPVIISTHSINFHSTLKDFRTRSLAALDSLLQALETKYPDLLYVHDQDLYAIVTEGVFRSRDDRVAVCARRGSAARPAHQGAL